MAVQSDPLQINPYTSTVPTVQVDPSAIGGATRPAPPLPGQFGGKRGSGGLAIGDALLKGFLQGHAVKEQKKQAQAQATIAAADAAEAGAFAKYQDALSAAGGDLKNPAAQAAYAAYLDVFNKSKETKAKFVLPEKPQKGKSSGGEKGKDKKPGFGGIKDFFEANPHIVPQIALMTMTPKPQGLSREAQLQNLEQKNLEQQIKVGGQQIDMNEATIAEQKKQDALRQQNQQVNEAGGYEKVLSDSKSTPELQTAARRMRAEAFEKQSPLDNMKMQGLSEIQSGASKEWSPEQRMMYASVGVGQMPQAVTVTGKNGHQQQVLIDPTTNQPVPGSKPLDLGPPQWAQQYYAQQAAMKSDLRKAVEASPADWGVQTGADQKANKAAIDARVEQLYIKASFGIQSLADQFGKTGYEVQRDNDLLQGLVKEVQLNGKTSWLDQRPPTLTYDRDTKGAGGEMIKSGQPVQVGREYFAKILNEFVTSPSENGGVMAFRDAPSNPDGKSAETLEAERRFMYQFVRNKLLTETGKKAMTPAQADAFLRTTSLGRPVSTNTSAGLPPPPQAPPRESSDLRGMDEAGLPRKYTSRLGTPPQAGQPSGSPKLYMVPGESGPVQLSDEEAAKARAAHIQIEELSPDLMNQFLGK